MKASLKSLVKSIGFTGVVATGVAIGLLSPLQRAVVGGFAGWIVGIFFGDVILSCLAALGVKGISMWQLGVTLGFIGGFFKSSVTTTNKSEK